MSNPLKDLDALPAEKRELLLKLLRQRKAAARQPAVSAGAITPAPRDQPSPDGVGFAMPLSFSQQRVWFLDQFETGTSAFNLVNVMRVAGDLDVLTLRRALDEIVRRHEVLRTVFAEQGGQPLQIIMPPASAAFELVDLCACPPAEQTARTGAILHAEFGHVFDLTRGPLFRTTLVRLEPQVALLCLNVHHIVFDGWSNAVLMGELTGLYSALRAGQPAPLPELPVQYADYAVWQRALLQGEYLERLLAYWRRQLGDSDGPLNLPTDRPRPAVRTSRGAYAPCSLDPRLWDGVRRLAADAGVSSYIVLLTALKTLLHRYSNDPRISVGTFIANRTRRAIEPLIGFFVNTLVLRTDLSGRPTFRQLIERVRETALGAYEHQDLPFEKLIEELQPARDMSRTPFFQVMLVLQNTPSEAQSLPGLSVEPFWLSEDHRPNATHFDLTFWLTEAGGSLEYNADLFDHATAVRLAEHLINLLRSALADPDQPITSIDVLSPEERAALLGFGAGLARGAGQPASVHRLFEAQAAHAPDATALECDGQRLSYHELNRRANQLAHHLCGLGVCPEERVGLLVGRSPELLVGLLGVLKAGAAYVPLDPTYPTERLQYMAADAQVRVLLTCEAGAAPWFGGATLDLAADWPLITRQPANNPAVPHRPEQLAYVIYTSGSLGQPKGVLIEHRSLAHYTEAARVAYAVTSADRVLQFASVSFDASAEEIYTALTSGATLVLRDDQMLETVETFLRVCAAWRISVLSLPTAFWHELVVRLAADALALPETLRLLIIGGERALRERVALWQRHVGARVRLLNTYGPTEATVVATLFAVPPEPPAAAQCEVPIGRPLRGLAAYVLDQHLAPAPVGVPGELCIGGVGLARGYLGRPDLTAERFVPNPFATGFGDQGSEFGNAALNPEPWSLSPRLYKTGDLARWRPDGMLEFVGRVDQQIKIRGFRIEPGEIQSVLLQHPWIDQALVLVRAAPAAGSLLVAYLVAGRRQDLQDSQLRAYLRERLPEYMIPAWFVWLDAFPLTPSGKVDPRGLPAPERSVRGQVQASVRPRDAIEIQLVALWEEILGLAAVGVQDNFFDLGGHSLLAVHLLARIQQRFQIQLPLNALFRGATVEHLADLLRGGAARPIWSPLVPLQTRGDKTPLFCVPGAGGNVIGFYSLARRLGADRPVYGLQARGLDGETAPHTSVEAMAAEYVAAIRQAQPCGPYLLCGHSFGSWVAFEVAQRLQRQSQTVGMLAIFNTPTPMILRDAPPQQAQDDTTALLNVARSIERAFGAGLGLTHARVQHLSADEQITLLTEALKRAGILPPEAETGQVRGFVRVFKTCYQIIYLPQDWRPTPIVLFRAAEQHIEDDDTPPSIRDDPAWGWGAFATAPVPVHVVPGEHLTILNEPHVQVLAEQLTRYLE